MREKIMRVLFGDANKRQLKKYTPIVEKINSFEPEISQLSDADLTAKTAGFKSELSAGKTLDDLLPEAFAVVREAGKRVLNMRPFDVQLMGGIVMHQGGIAEMKTGEGKTLVSTLSAYLNALEGKGVYIVTVNDYLAKRDSEWMGQIFSFLGLTVGLVQSNIPPEERIKAYAADITYGTNNEFGFDYLRDNLAWDKESCCQTRRHFAIIDEVDSILIDEARTPLIISGPVQDSTEKYVDVVKAVRTLEADKDFTLDEKHKNVILTDDGVEKLEAAFGVDTIYSVENMSLAHMSIQCLRALYLYQNEVDYVVKDGQVMIVDEFTGRILEGRRYSDGLHQSIEAVEGVDIQEESQTLASVTYQNYFRMFPKLAGMTGTAATEAEEFEKIYGLNVVSMPTNKPIIRKDQADLIYKTKNGKLNAIVNKIKELNEKGQPVLVGTIAIEGSEELSKALRKAGVSHKVLNAKYHEKEAEIITSAGEKGSVTIATNMAGRGTDIKLGAGVKDLGGLFVLGTERHESRRIDNQLRGRAGRQGDEGETRFFVSLEDSLMRLFGSDRIKTVMDKLGMDEDTPIEHGLITSSIRKAQEKVEKYHFGVRKQILQFDDVLNKQRETVYALRDRLIQNVKLSDKVLEVIADILHTYETQLFPEGKVNWTTEKRAELAVLLQVIFPANNTAEAINIGLEKDGINGVIKLFQNTYLSKIKAYPPGLFEAMVVKRTMLMTLDRKWIDHLHNMDALREGIGLRAYGQKDPLIEYKVEGFDMFKDMLHAVNEEAISMILRAEIMKEQESVEQK